MFINSRGGYMLVINDDVVIGGDDIDISSVIWFGGTNDLASMSDDIEPDQVFFDGYVLLI